MDKLNYSKLEKIELFEIFEAYSGISKKIKF